MTALDHLRKLTERRWEPIHGNEVRIYCGTSTDEDHAPDCPWVAAKAFVEAHESAREIVNIGGVRIETTNVRFDPDADEIEDATLRPAFTLIELLVVIAIIVLVSAVALPTILSALSHRQVSEAARTLSAALAGARDAAIRDNVPRGIRLLADPTFNGINPATGLLDASMPLAANRIIPIGSPPNYTEGRIYLYPGPGLPPAVAAIPYSGPGTPANPNPTWGTLSGCPLMVYESPVDSNGLLANPTSWFYNIRIGDQIQINNVGPWYTVVGPMIARNPELFVNVGSPGTPSPLKLNGINVEFLLLVNGRDDNNNGWTDEGADGLDNDSRNGIDDAGEWEVEAP